MKYFLFNMKRKIKLLPMICAILPIIMGIFYISLQTNSQKIAVDIFFEDNDFKNNFLLNIIRQTKSTKESVDINKSNNFNESMDLLKSNKINILISVPKNFYNSVLTGKNYPATVYFANNSPLVKGIFKSLITSSEEMLSEAQTNIYISDNISNGDVDYRNQKLNKVFFNSVLNREDLFEHKIIGEYHFNLTVVYILLLIISIFFIILKDDNYINNMSFLKVRKIPPNTFELWDIASSSTVLFIIGLFISILLSLKLNQKFQIEVILGLISISFFISSVNSLFSIVTSNAKAIFMLLIIIIFDLFTSNFIFPISIFPNSMLKIISFFPLGLIGKFSLINIIQILLYGIIITCISLYCLRRKLS